MLHYYEIIFIKIYHTSHTLGLGHKITSLMLKITEGRVGLTNRGREVLCPRSPALVNSLDCASGSWAGRLALCDSVVTSIFLHSAATGAQWSTAHPEGRPWGPALQIFHGPQL